MARALHDPENGQLKFEWSIGPPVTVEQWLHGDRNQTVEISSVSASSIQNEFLKSLAAGIKAALEDERRRGRRR